MYRFTSAFNLAARPTPVGLEGVASKMIAALQRVSGKRSHANVRFVCLCMHGTYLLIYSKKLPYHYLELGVVRLRVFSAGAVCPEMDFAITVIVYVVLSFKPRRSHEGVAHTEIIAFSTPAGFEENS